MYLSSEKTSCSSGLKQKGKEEVNQMKKLKEKAITVFYLRYHMLKMPP